MPVTPRALRLLRSATSSLCRRLTDRRPCPCALQIRVQRRARMASAAEGLLLHTHKSRTRGNPAGRNQTVRLRIVVECRRPRLPFDFTFPDRECRDAPPAAHGCAGRGRDASSSFHSTGFTDSPSSRSRRPHQPLPATASSSDCHLAIELGRMTHACQVVTSRPAPRYTLSPASVFSLSRVPKPQ